MRLLFFLVFLFSSYSSLAQTDEFLEFEDEYTDEAYYNDLYPSVYGDTIIYEKDLNYSKQRNFTNDLKKEYSGKDFVYVDDLKKPEVKVDPEQSNESDSKAADIFVSFMVNIFPYLLGAIVVFIIVSSFVDTKAAFWRFGKTKKKTAEKLLNEDDENIDENDYEALLNMAISKKDYRLATRYYYLALLKRLAHKELIRYHRDKTNTEYLFELQNAQQRSHFSYLAYLYDYVWYGEFPVDELKFNAIKSKYQSFLNSI